MGVPLPPPENLEIANIFTALRLIAKLALDQFKNKSNITMSDEIKPYKQGYFGPRKILEIFGISSLSVGKLNLDVAYIKYLTPSCLESD